MGSLLQQLENNEAILLMYLADELPAEDRAEVEQLLRTDASLRAEFERLLPVHEALRSDAGATARDSSSRLREAALVRDAGRLIRQWQVNRAAAAAAEAAEPLVRSPSRWWIYPIAAAAVVAVLYLAWWGANGEIPNSPAPAPGVEARQDPSPADGALADDDMVKFEQLAVPDQTEQAQRLDDAESQLAVLDALSGTTSGAILDTLGSPQP